MFNPRARTTVLHKALAELRSAEKRLRDVMLRPSRHREMTSALTRAEEACDAVTGQIREVDLTARAIERKRLIAPLLDAHRERVAELDGRRHFLLPDSAAAQRSDAQDVCTRARLSSTAFRSPSRSSTANLRQSTSTT